MPYRELYAPDAQRIRWEDKLRRDTTRRESIFKPIVRTVYAAVNQNPEYGEIWVEGNANPTVLVGGPPVSNWAQILDFNTDGPERGFDAVHTQDHIVINTPDSVVCEIMASASFSAAAGGGSTYEIEVQINNGATRLRNLHAERFLSAGDIGSISISGLADLDDGDTVELWVRQSAGAVVRDPTFRDVNLTVHKLHRYRTPTSPNDAHESGRQRIYVTEDELTVGSIGVVTNDGDAAWKLYMDGPDDDLVEVAQGTADTQLSYSLATIRRRVIPGGRALYAELQSYLDGTLYTYDDSSRLTIHIVPDRGGK